MITPALERALSCLARSTSRRSIRATNASMTAGSISAPISARASIAASSSCSITASPITRVILRTASSYCKRRRARRPLAHATAPARGAFVLSPVTWSASATWSSAVSASRQRPFNTPSPGAPLLDLRSERGERSLGHALNRYWFEHAAATARSDHDPATRQLPGGRAVVG
jgi:hypothetical protein